MWLSVLKFIRGFIAILLLAATVWLNINLLYAFFLLFYYVWLANITYGIVSKPMQALAVIPVLLWTVFSIYLTRKGLDVPLEPYLYTFGSAVLIWAIDAIRHFKYKDERYREAEDELLTLENPRRGKDDDNPLKRIGFPPGIFF